jgi:hypothetical protein
MRYGWQRSSNNIAISLRGRSINHNYFDDKTFSMKKDLKYVDCQLVENKQVVTSGFL